jgi:hypothetical protein
MLTDNYETGKNVDSLTRSNVPAIKREIKIIFEKTAKAVVKNCGESIKTEVGEKAVKAIKSDTAKSFFRQELGKANTLILNQIQGSFNDLISHVDSVLDKEGERHMAGMKAIRAKCFKDSAERVMKFRRLQREGDAATKENQVLQQQEQVKHRLVTGDRCNKDCACVCVCVCVCVCIGKVCARDE